MIPNLGMTLVEVPKISLILSYFSLLGVPFSIDSSKEITNYTMVLIYWKSSFLELAFNSDNSYS